MIVLTQKDSLKNILGGQPEFEDIKQDEINRLIENTDFTKFSRTDVEKLVSQLDDNKKQLLLNVLKSVK